MAQRFWSNRKSNRGENFTGGVDWLASATFHFICIAAVVTLDATSSTLASARLAANRAFSKNAESSRNAQRSTNGWFAASYGLRGRRDAAARASKSSYIRKSD